MTDVKLRSSCDFCLSTKVKCSQTKPSCARCERQGQECIYSQYRRIGRPSTKSAARGAARGATRMTRTGPKESSRCACTVHQHGSHQDQNRRNTNNAVISTTPTCLPTTEGQNTNNVADAGSNVSMAYANDSESIEPGVAVSARVRQRVRHGPLGRLHISS
ncbi:hypothetical protein QBC42DRAFT_274221 [Cladorrhinum samala]|uniref:Zn(2)-C6 fungal-type domain-containing protein n=1 Tax=Cladorrhinum samala TaxID=585594 RepID=A0AAV9HF19_9PEZI|nr:hypothetical protein QBC42DRAFT_274221 [Cladorrhinum samala]